MQIMEQVRTESRQLVNKRLLFSCELRQSDGDSIPIQFNRNKITKMQNKRQIGGWENRWNLSVYIDLIN